MAELTHAEWEFIDNSTSFALIDDTKNFMLIMEKIHPGPYAGCRDCFKRCQGHYPGEPHHAPDNEKCPMSQDIAEFNKRFHAKDNTWIEALSDEDEERECDCNCTCMERH